MQSVSRSAVCESRSGLRLKNFGAVQDLAYVRGLAKRIKATGAVFLLDIHYSDTWADPGKQFTPADWKKLDFDATEEKVHDYTVSVLTDLQADGVDAGYGAGGQ